MAKKKIDFKNMAMAFAGGAIAGIGSDKYEEYATKKAEDAAAESGEEFKPISQKVAPAIVTGAAVAVHYLGKGKMDALAYGMLGAAGSDFGTQILADMNKPEGDEAGNGTPSQLSPQQMNGLRERIIAMKKRGAIPGGAATERMSFKESRPGKVGSHREENTFYSNPYGRFAGHGRNR